MKNITFSAKEEAIEKAREVATRQHRTLNELFREWLDSIDQGTTRTNDVTKKFNELWMQTSYLQVGKKLTRDEMNER